MVVGLQQKTDIFSNLTQKTTELNKSILDKSNIILEALNNMNRTTNTNIPRNNSNVTKLVFSSAYFEYTYINKLLLLLIGIFYFTR